MFRYLLFLLTSLAWAQPPTTLIQDTLYTTTSAGYVPVQLGQLVISWPSFVYCGGVTAYPIQQGSLIYTVNNGVVFIPLVPTDMASSVVAYSVSYSAGPGVPTSRSYWQIPTLIGWTSLTNAQWTALTNAQWATIPNNGGFTEVLGWGSLTDGQWIELTNPEWASLPNGGGSLGLTIQAVTNSKYVPLTSNYQGVCTLTPLSWGYLTNTQWTNLTGLQWTNMVN